MKKQGFLCGVMLVAASAVFAADAGRPVTFSKDVAPILQAKCQDCHQPNSIAPMPLITYEETRPWARSIRQRVAARQMPPWHIDQSVGVQKFKNDISLSDAQIDTIVRWVDAGSPQGDPKDLPKPKPLTTSNEWQGVRDGFGAPDVVVKSDDYLMAARHQDVWWRSISDIPITEAKWIKMIEIRPSSLKARKIIHHSVAYLVLNENDKDAFDRGTAAEERGNQDDAVDVLVSRRPRLMEWAIGKGYDLMGPDTGRLVLPGEKIAWDQHIHAAEEDIKGGSEIGLWFYKKGQEPKHRSYLVSFTAIDRSRGLDIPPNSFARTEGFTVLKENAFIENFQPHFHLRGKAMQVEAIKPDGTRQVISYVANFNFNWMTNYIFADDAAPVLPKGTMIHVSAWFDNTRANKSNPDPEQWVGYGERTVDEMAHAWMNVTYLTDDEYKKIQQQRASTSVAKNGR